MRATLGEVMTDEAFERMIALGERFEEGVRTVIESRGSPGTWSGSAVAWSTCSARTARATAARPRRGRTRNSTRFIHLYLLNRGILMTPFHNMALMSPATTADDVDRHTAVFGDAADELVGATT